MERKKVEREKIEIKFYNSLSNEVELFYPIKEGEVKIYSCGPTVYDFAHIGNYRSFLFSDFLHRFFKFMGYKVKLVMNITDIDDKTIKGSVTKKVSLNSFTETYRKAFLEDLQSLGFLKEKVYPRATENISEMIAMTQKLIAKGLAYVSEGSVYFSIKKMPDYGKLSNLNLDEIKVGEKNLSDEYAKESISDFVLWKAHQADEGKNYYESPWGKGRPGWHIECSAMSKKFLGDHFDIHTGGVDNRFPHHENEIAQSEGANEEKFVNYWMHVSHLLVEGQKMSKSLGNFYTLKELLAKDYNPLSIRFMLLATHYRSNYNFTLSGIEAATTTLTRVSRFFALLKEKKASLEKDKALSKAQLSASALAALDFVANKRLSFASDLANDFNVSSALASFFDTISYVNKNISSLVEKNVDQVLDFVKEFNDVFGCFPETSTEAEKESPLPDEVLQLVQTRNEAKAKKDFTLADKLRNQVSELGYMIEDRADGVKVIEKK